MSTLDKIKDLITEQCEADEVKVQQLQSLEIQEIAMPKITTQIKKEIQKCKNLQAFCIVDCGLESLDNLPALNVSAVDFSKNKLSDSDLSKLTIFGDITQIMLAGNNITKLESIKCLSKLQNLQQIQLIDNPVASQQNYRDYIFENLPNLVYLDGKDKDGIEIPEEQEFQDDDQDDQEGFDDDQDQDGSDQDQEQQDQSPQPKKKR